MPPTVKQFLQQVSPFDELSEADLNAVLKHVHVKQFPRGAKVHLQGGLPGHYLYIVQAGAVKMYLDEPGGNEVIVENVGPGQNFGLVSLIDGRTSTATTEVVEDATCLLLEKEEFWRLFITYPAFSDHFSRFLARRLKRMIGAVIDSKSPSEAALPDAAKGAGDVSSLRVKDLISKKFISCSPDTGTREAASIMVSNRVGSVIILDEDGMLAGIVTDSDLRRALATSYEGPVRGIMSAPVITVSLEALAFEAIFEMLKHGIQHLAVVEGSRPWGVISNSDLLAAYSDSPMLLAREIDKAESCDQLVAFHSRTQSMMRALVDRGVGPYALGRIMAETNDRLVQKVISLVERDMVAGGVGWPPVTYCWLGVGSEGRREQTIKTDQDNALIYLDPPADRANETQAYFQLLASRVVEELVNCGFPPCNGGMMASNPRWCQPLSVWKKYFSSWIRELESLNLLHASIFFDFRPIWGNGSLSAALQEHLFGEIRAWMPFLSRLTAVALGHRPALGFFRDVVVEKTGEHKGTVDLKHRGILPLVNAVRIYALEQGLSVANTFERVQALEKRGVFSHDQAADIAGAYEFIMSLRIRHQLDQIKSGQPPDNFVNPRKLSRAERGLLKGYLAVIAGLQSRVEARHVAWFMS